MEKTDLYPSNVKPVRVGFYETLFYDAGWVYDLRVWWDGRMWRDAEKGWCLIDQDVCWRGLTMERTT